jgi:hypothetical protein
MDVPGIVRERLGDERRMTSVNIGGDDRVYVTPPQTLVYHSSGLFSRESIDEYSHDAQRFDVSADRREASFAFEYADGVRGFSVPRERIETILPPVLAGVLRTTGLIDAEESIEESYRFGERTLVVTDLRVLTSVGEAVWDRDHESYAYETITDLRFDNDLVIEIGSQSRRIELSGDGRREAYETVETALLAYHGVASIDELPQERSERQPEQVHATSETTAAEWDTPKRETSGASGLSGAIDEAESGPNAASSSPPSRSTTRESPDSPIRDASEREVSVSSDPTTAEPRGEATASPSETTTPKRDGSGATDMAESDELVALRESVERQTEILEQQQETLERLVETLDNQQLSDDQ